jgi:hypothetical protein
MGHLIAKDRIHLIRRKKVLDRDPTVIETQAVFP